MALDKEECKHKQFNRLKRLYLIYKCFEHYKTAILWSESAAINEDKVPFEDFSLIFGIEDDNEDEYILSENEMCDNALDEYEEYKNLTTLLDNETKSIMKQFCEYVISNKEYTFINGTGFLLMADFIKDIIKWQKGRMDLEEIKIIYGQQRKMEFYRKEILRTERIINDLINFNKKNL